MSNGVALADADTSRRSLLALFHITSSSCVECVLVGLQASGPGTLTLSWTSPSLVTITAALLRITSFTAHY